MEGVPLDLVEVENQPFRFQIVTGGGRPAVLFSIPVPFSIPGGDETYEIPPNIWLVIVAYSTDRHVSRVKKSIHAAFHTSFTHPSSRVFKNNGKRSTMEI